MTMEITIPEGMEDAALLAIIIGFFSPLVLNLIINANWKSWVKSLVAFGFAAVAGVLTAWVSGAFEGLPVLSTVLLILVVSITAYQNFWKQVAPNLQRGSKEKAAADEAKKQGEIARIAAPVAQAVAENEVQSLPIAQVYTDDDPSRP
jgi:hypothetical protein